MQGVWGWVAALRPSVRATPGLVMEDCGVPNGCIQDRRKGGARHFYEWVQDRIKGGARQVHDTKPNVKPTVAHKTLPQLESLSKYVQYTY